MFCDIVVVARISVGVGVVTVTMSLFSLFSFYFVSFSLSTCARWKVILQSITHQDRENPQRSPWKDYSAEEMSRHHQWSFHLPTSSIVRTPKGFALSVWFTWAGSFGNHDFLNCGWRRRNESEYGRRTQFLVRKTWLWYCNSALGSLFSGFVNGTVFCSLVA